MADAGVQPYWPRGLGGYSDAQRAIRSALYVRHVRDGAVLHADRDWVICAALETARRAKAVPLYGLSLAASYLCIDGGSLDLEHDFYAAYGIIGGNAHRVGGCAGVCLLAAEQPESDGLIELANVRTPHEKGGSGSLDWRGNKQRNCRLDNLRKK